MARLREPADDVDTAVPTRSDRAPQRRSGIMREFLVEITTTVPEGTRRKWARVVPTADPAKRSSGVLSGKARAA
ncbi:hypothetical protein GCM10029978_007520 [Actinoallomurus acanthiterrae]